MYDWRKKIFLLEYWELWDIIYVFGIKKFYWIEKILENEYILENLIKGNKKISFQNI